MLCYGWPSPQLAIQERYMRIAVLSWMILYHMNSNQPYRCIVCSTRVLNTFRQNGRRFADDTLECIFFDKKVLISIDISLKFVSKGLIDNKSSFVRVTSGRRTHGHYMNQWWRICVTRFQWLQWVNGANSRILNDCSTKSWSRHD